MIDLACKAAKRSTLHSMLLLCKPVVQEASSFISLLLLQYRMTKDYTDFKYVYPRTMDKFSIAFIVMTLCEPLLLLHAYSLTHHSYMTQTEYAGLYRSKLDTIMMAVTQFDAEIAFHCRLEGRKEVAHQLSRCRYC